jgi:hypothetical protein
MITEKWRLEHAKSDVDSEDRGWLYDIIDEHNDTIAICLDEEHAALIAAAPDLLDFAKMAVDCKYEPDKLLCHIERYGVKAIAKAEGK